MAMHTRVDGNVYFDVVKYNKDHAYGKLSGRNIEDMMSNTRELDGQSEKRNAVDFAFGKKLSRAYYAMAFTMV